MDTGFIVALQNRLPLIGGDLGALCAFWVLATAASVFWILMMMDAVGRERTGNERFWWAMVILVFPVAGALVYLVVRRTGHRHVLVRASRPH